MTLPHHLPIPELYVSSEAAAALARDAERLPAWTLDPRQMAELDLLLSGGFAPLRGYMTEAQHQILRSMSPMDAIWPAPVVLAVEDAFADAVQPGDDIALCHGDGRAVAVLSVTDRWQIGPVLLGGKVKGLRRADPDDACPNALRRRFHLRGSLRVLAVQPSRRDQLEAGADLARHLDAALLLQTLPGAALEGADLVEAELAPLAIAPPSGLAGVLWTGLVARNHGATHLLLDADAAGMEVYRQYQEALGLPEPVRPPIPGSQ